MAATMAVSDAPPQSFLLWAKVSFSACLIHLCKLKSVRTCLLLGRAKFCGRRASEIGGEVQEGLANKLLSLPLEKLVESCWSWYEPHMFQRPGCWWRTNFCLCHLRSLLKVAGAGMSPICSRGRGAGYVYVCYATRFSTNFCSICFIQ